MHIGELIRQFRKEHNITLEEFGKRIGKSKAYISMLEKNKNSRSGKPIAPSAQTFINIATALHLTLDELLSLLDEEHAILVNEATNNRSTSINFIDDSIQKETYTLPSHIYNYAPVGISAGALSTVDPIYSFDEIEIPDVVLGRYARNKHLLFMHVNGQSMNNIIPDGALIAVKRDISCVDDGDIIVAFTDEGYTVKRLYHDKVNNRIILQPDSNDPSFTPIIVDCEEQGLPIVGKVVMYNIVL